MAGALRQSCSSCTRYLSPSSTNRSLQDTAKYASNWSPPSSPQKLRAIKPQLFPHAKRQSASFLSKQELMQRNTDWMQTRPTEGARHSSTFKKTIIDIPAFIQLLSVLNIDLPRYFPDIVNKNKNRIEILKEKILTDKHSDKIISQVSKDDSIQNLREAEKSLEATDLPQKGFNGIIINQRKEHEYYLTADASNRGMFRGYMTGSITIPDVKEKSNNRTTDGEFSPGNIPNKTPKKPEPSQTKSISTVNLVKQITNYIPYMATGSQDKSLEAAKAGEKKKKQFIKQGTIAHVALDNKTRGLVKNLRTATRTTSQLVRLEEFCSHIAQYPDTKNIAVKVGIYDRNYIG